MDSDKRTPSSATLHFYSSQTHLLGDSEASVARTSIFVLSDTRCCVGSHSHRTSEPANCTCGNCEANLTEHAVAIEAQIKTLQNEPEPDRYIFHLVRTSMLQDFGHRANAGNDTQREPIIEKRDYLE